MPWVRIDEKAMEHPKVAGLPDGAFRLWVQGLAHCQKFLTDGAIDRRSLKFLRAYSPKRVAELIECRLWDAAEDHSVHVHDYLEWNESREDVLHARDSGKRRTLLLRDPELRHQVRERDGDQCRYCGAHVIWHDRRSVLGGTYDHVDPAIGNTFENLVVACRGCNSRKHKRTPAEAGMVLRSIRIRSNSDLSPDLDQRVRTTSDVLCSSQQELSVEREGGAGETPPERAGNFCEWYADAHRKHIGVGYIGNPRKDYEAALLMVAEFTDAEVRDAALVWFGMDDDFATSGTRTISKFASRVTKCVQLARSVA